MEIKAPPGYEILEELGRGGMGVVYRARQLSLDRIVALKVLIAPEGHEINPSALKRLRSEASIQAEISHENVVRLYDCEVSGALPYLTLELVDGARTLHDLVVDDPPVIQAGLATMERVASALACVHRQSIIHRDLKPQNILIDKDGRPLLTDFGVSLDLLSTNTRCTVEFSLVGTPTYMSPEQLQGRSVDHRTDIYAFGLILYEVVCRKLIFSGKGSLVPLATRIANRIPLVTDFKPDVPGRVIKILDRCLAFDPKDRYPTADDLLGELTMLVETAPAGSGQPEKPLRPASPPRVVLQKVPKRVTARLAPLQPPSVTPPGIAAPPAPMPAPHRNDLGRWLALAAAVSAAGFAAVSSRVVSDRTLAHAIPSTSSAATSPSLIAGRLVVKVGALKHDEIGLGWLERFAKRQRSSLAACGAGDAVAGHEVAAAIKASLESLELLASLNEFLPVAHGYFADGSIAEETRWATRRALIDLELIERFCLYHRVPWSAIAKDSLVAAVDGATSGVVNVSSLDLQKARSWIRMPMTTPDRYFPGESRLLHWVLPQLPENERALLWFGTLRWPGGHILDISVNATFRTLVSFPKPTAEVPPIKVNMVETSEDGKVADPAHLITACTTEPGIRGFNGIWLPRAAVSPKSEVCIAIINLPGARVEGMRNPAVVERVMSFVTATEE